MERMRLRVTTFHISYFSCSETGQCRRSDDVARYIVNAIDYLCAKCEIEIDGMNELDRDMHANVSSEMHELHSIIVQYNWKSTQLFCIQLHVIFSPFKIDRLK